MYKLPWIDKLMFWVHVHWQKCDHGYNSRFDRSNPGMIDTKNERKWRALFSFLLCNRYLGWWFLFRAGRICKTTGAKGGQIYSTLPFSAYRGVAVFYIAFHIKWLGKPKTTNSPNTMKKISFEPCLWTLI